MIANKKHSAFLLSEALVSLFILILTFSIMVFLINSYHNNNKHLFQNESSWAISMLRLEQLTADASLIKADNKTIEFESGANYKFPHKIYHLQVYHNMLRVTGKTEGHMPLLLNQQNINFITKGHTVQINAIDQFQRKWEYYLDFQ
ncbi:MAG: ComGF family competence protein [Lactobacillus sp.]|uniref:Uncharacterized protein n=1 Tax=Bombilactobacillus bombi TaxID=1303590 RepID=A0A347SRS8_9LACO|nr:ComGF family competence protein [Bombilactobacillus bombi]AXX64737.1 hypothetical protein DS830_04305 [Bombilactobacillus bombi]MCO6542691.1 ComGF family competence protein [Lactobacillus sp.]RHW47301.1 hypothetical protein DS832_03895 [Bombilactobacillus bombi]